MPVPTARGTISRDGQQIPMARAVYEVLNPDTPIRRAKKICKTPFCQNPHHWVFILASPPLPPAPLTECTLQDAIDLLDRYLCFCPDPPLDFQHDLLIDIPPVLLSQALIASNKEYLL